MTYKQKWFFGAIVVIAIFFRFYLIQKMPGGLFPDEAANGLDINLMQQGHLQPFYERGNGREALFFYLEWGSVALFGKGVWQFHVVSALIGVLTVIATFYTARMLFGFDAGIDDPEAQKRAVNIGLLAAFLTAVSSWHTVLSRTALRANLTPLFGCLTLFFLLRVYTARQLKTKLWLSVVAGTVFALGFYTYIAFRIMAPVVVMVLLWPLLSAWRSGQLAQVLKKYWLPALLFLGSCILVLLPLAVYFYHHFDFFIGRSGQVSVYNQDLYTVDGRQLTSKPPVGVVLSVVGEVAKTALTGFFVRGDLNWRQNISGYPLLSPLVSPFFAVGLVFATLIAVWYFFSPVRRFRFWRWYVLAGWFWAMLLPEITTAEGIPHGLRSAGIIPPVFIITAASIYAVGRWTLRLHDRLHEHWPKGRMLVKASFAVLAGCFFVGLMAQTYALYFVYAYHSPENFYYFRSDLTTVSDYVLERCNQSMRYWNRPTKDTTLLILDEYWLQTTDYLTSDSGGDFAAPCNIPYTPVNPGDVWKLPPLLPGHQVIFTQSTVWAAKGFAEHHPNARLVEEVRNKFGQTEMGVYEVINNGLVQP